MSTKILLSVLIAGAILIAVLVTQTRPGGNMLGSTVQGNDYYATSTRNFDGTALGSSTRLKGAGNDCVSGALARVTITGAGAGRILLWNATTTNILAREAKYSSSTILLADIPLSAVANTYEFDMTFSCGLIYDIVGTAPTSTIMWR